MILLAKTWASALSVNCKSGTLGEHQELTAIKTSGISLTRILMQAFSRNHFSLASQEVYLRVLDYSEETDEEELQEMWDSPSPWLSLFCGPEP